jgi:hypothetical protein
MSRISDLGKDYSGLPDILAQLEDELVDVDKKLENKGLLETCISENVANMHYYDERRIRLRTLVNYFKMEVDRVRSELYVSYTENYSRKLSPQQVTKYIDREPKYLEVYQLLLEIEELYGRYERVVEDFKSRAFALQYITKLRIANLEFTEL